MKPEHNYCKLISIGALVALLGFILSGPVAFFVVNIINPQPSWISPKLFVDNYSAIQDLPFYFGFLLIGGMLMVVAGHFLNCKEENQEIRFHLLIALSWTIVDVNWVMSTVGFVSYFIWNILMIAMMIAIYKYSIKHKDENSIHGRTIL